MSNSLKNIIYENHSGFEPAFKGLIPVLPKRHTLILDQAISGEAPKDFIRVYEFGRTTRKSNPRAWIPYIAKGARKWYPNESITEHLLNRLGDALGITVANSKLVVDEELGQLRFLSEYFLRKSENLEHGAEIFAGYLSNGQLVDVIEKGRNTAQNYFTFQFVIDALKHRFGHGVEGQKILEDFVKMLCFDAVTGNNDRHTYNWGVICDLNGKRMPRFSPVFDSARGLFWNEHEDKLLSFQGQLGMAKLEKYLDGSRPHTGWEGQENVNHFDLMRLINQNYPEFRSVFESIITSENQAKMLSVLEVEFEKMFSPRRYSLIKDCLNLRFQRISNLL